MNKPDWYEHYESALSPAARNEIERASLKKEYDDEFTLVNQAEKAAFDLAAKVLVRRGRPAYFRRSLGLGYVRDPLTTGFRAIGEPIFVPHENGAEGVIVPAVRLGLGYLDDEKMAHIPYKDINRAQRDKADVELVARKLGKVVGRIEFRGYMLATYLNDVNAGASSGIVREAPIGSRWLEIFEKLWHTSDPDDHMRHALHHRPAVALWSVPLPELAEVGCSSGEVWLGKDSKPNLAPYQTPGDYAQAASSELASFADRIPVCWRVMELLGIAEAKNMLVSSLDAHALKPVPLNL